MSDRKKSIARIVKLQGKVANIAAAKLASVEAQKAALVANREALQAYIDGEGLTGPLASVAIRHVRSLAVQEVAAENRRLQAQEQRQQAETRLKLAERMGEIVGREEAAAAERKALERLIEAAIGRDESGRDPG